jgi:beta-glucanase (GH16 family)
MKADSSLSIYARLALEFFDMDGVSVGSISKVGGVTVRPGDDWTRAAQQIIVPDTAVEMKVMLQTFGSSGICWFDDLSLTPSGWYAPGVVPAPENPPLAGTWTPTFEDNFNGSELDGTKWKMGHHWLMNGLAGLTPDAILVSNGVLSLRASLEPVFFGGTVRDFSSGEISTYKKFAQQYGYFEVRMRYAPKLGVWPAFWTMPDRGIYGNQNNNFKTYIKFDLSGIDDPVESAEIRLRVKDAETGDNIHRMLNIYPVGDDWSENTLTWNNMPLEKPLWISHDYDVAPLPGDELVYDLTDYINEQLAGDGVASIVIYDTFARSAQIVFGSRESDLPEDRPRLVLDGVVVEASEDVYARGGSFTNTNYGTSQDLVMQEEWGRNNSTYDGGMEMDIMEALGVWKAYKFQNAMHWDGYGVDHQSQEFAVVDPAFDVGEYHTYGMYWEEGLIEYYLDGTLTGSMADDRVCSVPAYLILSLQMGGWDGNDNTNNYEAVDYPVDMDIDYVKVWQGVKE